MSLAVALEGCDGVVLAVDSRGTIGDPRGLTAVNDTHQKLFRLTRWAGICIFGAAEIGVELVRRIQAEIASAGESEARVEQIEERVRGIARREYGNWFSSFQIPQRPALGLLLAGICSDSRPRTILFVSQLDFAPQVAVSGVMMGGIPQYAIYLTHRFYDASQSVTKLQNLAEYLISETATQDQKVGGPVKMARISNQNGYEDVSLQEVDVVQSRNRAQSKSLREHFYREDTDDAQGA
ncbi:MAG: hypothetical protein ACE149_17785 [Armatimonadota bacterium]